MVAGDDEAAADGSELGGELQGALETGDFNHAFANFAAGEPIDFAQHGIVVVHRDRSGRAELNGEASGRVAARNSVDASARLGRELNEQQAKESETNDGDAMMRLNIAPAENVHRTTERFSRKGFTGERVGQSDDLIRGARVAFGKRVVRQRRDAHPR